MKLTLAGEYAIRAMMHLASLSSDFRSKIPDISVARDIPEAFLRKLVPMLTRAGLIASVRGVGGGLKLGRSANAITLLDVIEAVEGPIALNRCFLSSQECDRVVWCSVHAVWSDAQNKMKEVLRSKSLAELSRLDAEQQREYAARGGLT